MLPFGTVFISPTIIIIQINLTEKLANNKNKMYSLDFHPNKLQFVHKQPQKKNSEKHDYFISSKSKKIVSVKSKVTMCQMFFIYWQTSSFSMLNQFQERWENACKLFLSSFLAGVPETRKFECFELTVIDWFLSGIENSKLNLTERKI